MREQHCIVPPLGGTPVIFGACRSDCRPDPSNGAIDQPIGTPEQRCRGPTGWLEKKFNIAKARRQRSRERRLHGNDVTVARGHRRGDHGRGDGGRRRREKLGSLLLDLLFHVHLAVALLLVAASELAAAHVALERFLAGVRADVRRQVVAATERTHADAALERLLAGVDADVAGQFVAAGEASVARLDGAGVRPLVRRRLARAVRILALLDRQELEGAGRLLVGRADHLERRRGRLHARVVAAGGRREKVHGLALDDVVAGRRERSLDVEAVQVGHARLAVR